MTLDWLEPVKGNNHIQGSEAWLQWRGKGMGSSDAPVLMGVSPWKTLYQLWGEKSGLIEVEFKENPAMKRGKELEPVARKMYEDLVGHKYPDGIATDKEYEFMRASFDGINSEQKRIIEIKSPGKKDHETALSGNVPDKYYPQVQWLLMVAGFKHCDYVSFDGVEIVVVPVEADEKYIAELRAKAISFWNCVQTKTPPPTDEEQIEDVLLESLLESYFMLQEREKEIKERLDTIKNDIKGFIKGSKATCGIYKLAFETRKGNVDYAKVPELKNVNLDQYRKADIISFTIRKSKKDGTTQ